MRSVLWSDARVAVPWGGNGSAPSAGYHLCHRPQTWCFGGLCSIGLGCNTIIHMWTHPCVHIYSYVIFITMVHEVLALTGRHNQSCWADALVFVFFRILDVSIRMPNTQPEPTRWVLTERCKLANQWMNGGRNFIQSRGALNEYGITSPKIEEKQALTKKNGNATAVSCL